jgi:hypothetical protein
MAAPRTPAFRGRSRERIALDRLLDRVRDGENCALVIQGETGVGKTALLRYYALQASGCRVAELAGVEPNSTWRSPRCTSCAGRCWATSPRCRGPSSTRCASPSG